MRPFNLEIGKKFPKLSHAPIGEAVIQWIASPTHALNEADLLEKVKSRFPDYTAESQLEVQVEAEFQGKANAEGKPIAGIKHRSKWDGLRLTSTDEKHVCQFRPNGVAFSRLKPYEDWEKFTTAATPFWLAFVEWANPPLIDRIGVRFISQIDLESGNLADYMEEPSSSLESIGLKPAFFFHKDVFSIPGYPYGVTLNRTIQSTVEAGNRSLIVDIDITTTETTMLESTESRLQEMRFIKNEIFFAFMKDAEKHFS